MECRIAEVPITDFIKVWCEHCCIRIDLNEERIEASGKAYHPHCHSEHFSAIPEPIASREPSQVL